MREMDRVNLNVNDPRGDPDGMVFAYKVEMKKHSTLLELKQKIGEMFDLKISEFTVKRNMVQRELKNLD